MNNEVRRRRMINNNNKGIFWRFFSAALSAFVISPRICFGFKLFQSGLPDSSKNGCLDIILLLDAEFHDANGITVSANQRF